MKPNWILDIETTTDERYRKIRLVGMYDLDNRVFNLFNTKPGFLEFLDSKLQYGDIVGTWYGERFDLFQLSEIWDIDLWEIFNDKGVKHLDGFLLKKILMPESIHFGLGYTCTELRAPAEFCKEEPWNDPASPWFGNKEGFYNDALTAELAAYLRTDLKATAWCIDKLTDMYPAKMWQHPLRVEQEVARQIEWQQTYAVKFDEEKAEYLYERCAKEALKILAELPDIMVKTPSSDLVYPPKKRWKKDGTETAHWTNFKAKFPDYSEEDYKYRRAANPVRPINWSSVKEVKEVLLNFGWKPTMYNYKGKERKSPMLVERDTREPCPNLGKLGLPWIDDYITYLQIRARMSLIGEKDGKTGLRSKVDGGFIKADADSCGTPTARMKHRGVVNIPRVGSFLGKELRSLFTKTITGNKMVGWDATSLEAVIEAHYCYPYDESYAKDLVEGDVHTKNMKALGLKDRDAAKKFKYMITYGAQPPKIARSMGVDLNTAQEWFDGFWEHNVALDALRGQLLAEWRYNDKKYITGLDGRPLFVRKEHAIINTLFQSGGAILMKHALIIANGLQKKEITDANCFPLIRMHDEEQWETADYAAEQLGKIGVRSIELAGEYFGLRVPITGEYKIGDNWAETH